MQRTPRTRPATHAHTHTRTPARIIMLGIKYFVIKKTHSSSRPTRRTSINNVSVEKRLLSLSSTVESFVAASVDGVWSLWSRWSRCSATCGHGVRKRSRQCTSPRPKFGGRPCDGHPLQTVSCRVKRQCPGRWTVQLGHGTGPERVI